MFYLISSIISILWPIVSTLLLLIIVLPIAGIAYLADFCIRSYQSLAEPTPESRLNQAAEDGEKTIVQITNKYRKQLDQILKNS